MASDTYYLQASRRMWQQFEPVHALVYFAPEVFEEFAALGYDTATRWPTYASSPRPPLSASPPCKPPNGDHRAALTGVPVDQQHSRLAIRAGGGV
ncbi:MAG TPA: hypothetical protein VH912_30265 [Streptosporangiaceae bacterium]|jgi:hypothetical protein